MFQKGLLMKKLIFYALALFCTLPLHSLEEEQCIDNRFVTFSLPNFTSQTFFYPRPVYNNTALKQSIWHRMYSAKEAAPHSAFQVIGMYQETLNSKKVINYFTFDCKQCLTVKGDNYKCERDIRAEWLGINDANFSGEFSLNPHQRQAGVLIDYLQDVSHYIEGEFFENWWIGVTVPLIVVKNDIGICQSIISEPINVQPDIIEAFNQEDWKYARLSPCEHKNLGLGNIYLKLGTDFLSQDGNEVGLYSSFILPGDRVRDPKYLFDAFVGNNRHFGVGMGVNLALRLNEQDHPLGIILFANIENELYFDNTQKRTFDLKGRPWSRYLLFNSIDGERDIPGVNVLTREVKIKPFNIFDLSTGLRFQTCRFEAEIGYDLWGHGDQRILLKQPWDNDKYGIAGQGNLDTDCPRLKIGATASDSTISEQSPNDVDENGDHVFVSVRMNDLDFSSAISRETLTNKFHFALGYVYQGQKLDWFIGAGAYWENPENNGAFEQFGAWGKLGASY